MIIAFFVMLVVVGQLLHQVAVDQSLGLNPYPFGSTILCYITHLILLVTCIRYLGWIFGILLFLGEFFAITHVTIGWILQIPSLFIVDIEKMFKLVRFRIAMLTPALVASLVFCIVSFFVSPYKSALTYLKSNIIVLLVIAIVAVVLGIVRIFVAKALQD